MTRPGIDHGPPGAMREALIDHPVTCAWLLLFLLYLTAVL